MTTDSPAMPHVAIRAVVANASRLASWMEARDLQQEAALVMIEAARTWRPELGTLSNYQAKAVARHLQTYIAAQASPVHHREHHRAPAVERASVEALALVAAPAMGMERALDLDRAAREVRAIMEGYTPAARAVLIEERRPAEVAREHGLSVRQVYNEAQYARRALRSSRVLARLAVEL
jgi:DNA-directed RNA polymerase specialized sigma24 family protein